MIEFWLKLVLEISFLALLGVLYYFYQKKKLLGFDQDKIHIIMEVILNSCLNEKNEYPQPELDRLIETIDDYLKGLTPSPPLDQIRHYLENKKCSEDLRSIINEGLKELEPLHAKK